MSHVAPHRLADLARGSLGARAARRAQAHVDECASCQRALARVRAARTTFPELAALPAPELRWDRVRAQTYWTLGTGSQPAMPVAVPSAPPRRGWWLAAPLGLAAAAAAAWLVIRPTDTALRPALARVDAPVAPPALVVAPAPLAAVVTLVESAGTVTTADGRTLVGGSAVGAHPLVAGDRIDTGDGRLAAQFGAGSTVTVGPHAALTLARFDAGGVELVLGAQGQVDIEVSHRAPEQRFVVRVGGRAVEVRGTAFRVARAGAQVEVACEHGRVAVSSSGAADAVELGAGQRLAVVDGEPVLGHLVRPLTEAELAELLAARPAPLPQWTDPDTIFRTTVALPLLVPAGRAVAIDGVVVGAGPLWRRLPPGRHLVELHDRAGHAQGGQWVELDGSTPERPLVIAEAAAEPTLTATGTAAARRQRLVELSRALDQRQLRNCVRSLAKQGLADGTHVELEVGVQASGAIRYLNIVDTDLPARSAACVRDVVSQTRLGDGAQVSWRHRVTF
ncbi:MAG: FecR domain-containing protein [Myxococcales bacterium]|nr:FecR domain-containing protein [Myxococcales bacterium]